MSRYDYTLQHRPGKLASRPYSGHANQGDNRLEFRDVRLLNLDAVIGNAVFIAPIAAKAPTSTDEDEQPLE